MPRSRWFALFALLFAFVLVAGCASGSREFTRDLDPIIGRVDKAYFLDKYGEPDRKSALDADTEVWEYTFGQQSLSDYGARTNLATSTLLRLTFRNGTFTRWQTSARVR